MATSNSTSSFTLAAVAAMRKLYPESLADKSFDNTGLLLESPINKHRKQPLRSRAMLAIDLTTAVADEAIEKDVSLVVAYHPIIFRGLKSITTADSQQRSLLRLASEGISVYSPHTAVDAASDGNADWLLDMTLGRFAVTDSKRLENPWERELDVAMQLPRGGSYYWGGIDAHPEYGVNPTLTDILQHERKAIIPSTELSTNDKPVGMGRQADLATPTPLKQVLSNLLHNLDNPSGVKVALPYPGQSPEIQDMQVRGIAVCAGSGGSILSKANDADLWVTGEMSHHEVLAATERGTTVVCLDHSNSERGYLEMVMKGKLHEALVDHISTEATGITVDDVIVSQRDQDPFGALVYAPVR